MTTTMTWENTFEAGTDERPRVGAGSGSRELVKAFGERIYSIARHITQSVDDAGNVLIDTFLEVGSDLCSRQDDEKLRLRLVTIAVRDAFSKVCSRSEGRPPLDRVSDSMGVLEHGLLSLEPMCRAVFVLRDIEQIPVGQIANIVSRSVGTVEDCLLTARLQLREILTSHMAASPGDKKKTHPLSTHAN